MHRRIVSRWLQKKTQVCDRADSLAPRRVKTNPFLIPRFLAAPVISASRSKLFLLMRGDRPAEDQQYNWDGYQARNCPALCLKSRSCNHDPNALIN